jgi:hypothetical protein
MAIWYVSAREEWISGGVADFDRKECELSD